MDRARCADPQWPPLTLQAAVQKRALNVLKQKKMYEGQLDQLQQQTFNMEQAAMTTDNLRNTMATVDAMKTANKEMRRQYGKIDIDKIEVRVRPLLSADGPGDTLRHGGSARAGQRDSGINVADVRRAGGRR